MAAGAAAITACTAQPGYRGAPGTAAVVCSANTYCPAGAVAVTPCPLHTVSAPGSTSAADCKATAGYYGPAGAAGHLCPPVSPVPNAP